MTQSQAQDISVTKMLLSVIFVFLVCNSVKIYVYMASLRGKKIFIVALAELLVASNPSFNFIIYCLFNKNYRTKFLDILVFRNSKTGTIITVSGQSRRDQNIRATSSV